MQNPNSDVATLPMPKWAKIFSWCGSLALCAALVWVRNWAWTRGSVAGLVLTFCFAAIWIRMAVRVARGEPIPPFLRKPPVGPAISNSWLDSPVGVLLQTTLILVASIGIALLR
jgi:hypothetical protein